ncbi:hypothetical protein EYC84_001831 [Monilinia fructicola]|uniref:Bis(5'-adenosyl)-triphosphatase n=1 Tax=Monilinia fructicola TaxID=38448 RepID=A0A5M9JT61_MONFR|nr:hypothetical protein EYC84_001831 [Monilinia fructicola]
MIVQKAFSKVRLQGSPFRNFQHRTMSSSTSSNQLIHFGKFEVTDQVFHKSTHCYCLVNIKPILPGHVLVIPYKQHPRMTDLSPHELSDIFLTTQKVQKMLASHYFPREDLKEGSFNVAIQDGPESGQTVPHFHCHIIPRTKESTVIGDGIYDKLQGEEGNVGGGLWDRAVELGERPVQKGKFPKVDDEDRLPRSAEEMNQEAALFREQMRKLGYSEREFDENRRPSIE